MKKAARSGSAFIAMVMLASASVIMAYPLDGYEETRIRRVEGARLANEGLAIGGFQPPGALLTTGQVDLRLLGKNHARPPADPVFSSQIKTILGENADRYGIAVLDLTNPDNPRYAEHRGTYRQNVGSVGKLLVALGYFQALADAWPDDPDRRKEVLRDTVITADHFSQKDSHQVRLFDVETRRLSRRPIEDGDRGSVWEYLDWMLSASSNSGASMVMRDAMLLRHFGQQYPRSEEQVKAFFSTTQGSQLTGLFQQTFWEPVTRNGMSLEQIRQGSFFTAQGKKIVNGGGNSYATARSLMDFLVKMEEGVLVDEWSSRQLKRLLYMTERRVRYASAPELKDAAVYFKSGSWYKCKPEEGFKCSSYSGNVFNYMSSVAIVEQEVDGVNLQYMVTVISNVLRQNSETVHRNLGAEIHQLIKLEHVPVSP